MDQNRTTDMNNTMMNRNDATGIQSPGYSERIKDPAILKAMKKSKKAASIFGFILVPLPIIGFAVYSIVTDKMELAAAVKYGLIVSAIFLIFTIIGLLKQSTQRSYEGVVTDKKILRTNSGSDGTTAGRESYVTYVRTTDGKKKKIVETTPTHLSAWKYLNVGENFKYHPQLAFPYEKYDKTKETQLYCVGCLKSNPVQAEYCSKCGLPLLK